MASRPPQLQNGHPSRRENHSISSNTSASGRSERGSRNPSNPPVESAVTRLLVSIKQLLEALTLWSQIKMDETQVSDVYVRLGNDFNAAVTAFAGFDIDMAELMSVPNDLRNVLEQCLAEDATSNLEIYLPTVREIITNLLQGLRGKQSIYRRIRSDQRHRSGEQGHERAESRSSRSERTPRRGDGTAHRSQLSRTIDASEAPEAAGSVSKRVVQTSARRRDQNSESVSREENLAHKHTIVPDGYNIGRDEFVQAAKSSKSYTTTIQIM
ncbi:uncharacterized protein LACBIDRAFT_313920 [Laccaria bicolor S238N-H82]|uniref:Predicted protein n=1 Tax=Laccaria bicolor (strain S238N-H82 / ATCC MYA-4686) TaxID=486041 RepID=B0D154_LACBS|nr:uncharacterized protein LACBIDRAFT_313920 [Laccaria bicolor S238N-H82]EDR11574.1 predicted protein [Laccaria bicolor S238N-H82]|eukprot:XP_001877471.1 predicted protein [Laccaria bicolor S238N-H82]